MQAFAMEKPTMEAVFERTCSFESWGELPELTKHLVRAFQTEMGYDFIQDLLNGNSIYRNNIIISSYNKNRKEISPLELLKGAALHCFESKDYSLIRHLMPYFKVYDYSVNDLLIILENYQITRGNAREQNAYSELMRYLRSMNSTNQQGSILRFSATTTFPS